MVSNNKNEIDTSKELKKVKDFLNIQNFSVHNISLKENIKEICVAKLCDVVGIKCAYNYKNEFFNYFSSVTGEAICQLLNIPIVIAEDNLRLFKYNHINLVEKVKEMLNNNFLEDAYIDVFQFLDNNKHFVGIE